MRPETDFHTHILPGVDDGSRDLQMSLQMLRAEAEAGVRQVVATPHFYADSMRLEYFDRKRAQALEQLQSFLAQQPEEKSGNPLPHIIPASETAYYPGISGADPDDLKVLCAAGSDVLFLEMPFCQWDKQVCTDVSRLAGYHGLTVVLVHLERFLGFQKDKGILREILQLPVWLQVNAGTFSSMAGRRKIRKILSFGRPIVLGSDCHNMDGRRPNLAQAADMIEKKFKEEADRFAESEQRLLARIPESTPAADGRQS